MDILFTNATILPMTAAGDEPKTFMGAVGVAGNRIALVTASGSEADAFRTCNPGVRVIDCTGRLLMPGLVNTALPCGHDAATQLCRRHRPDGVAQRLYMAFRGAPDGRRRGAGHDARHRRDAPGRRHLVRGHVLPREPLRGGRPAAGHPRDAGLQLFRQQCRRGAARGGEGRCAGC